MNLKRSLLLLMSSLMFWVSSANAIIIEYELTNIGGNDYRYDYTITNDSAVTLEWFSIDFDERVIDESSLTVVSDASTQTDWNEIFFSSNTGVGLPAMYDVLADPGPGIAAGMTESGFAVEFTALGAFTEVQRFFIWDVPTFAYTEIGNTVARFVAPDPTTTVPEPSTLAMFGLGLLGFSLRKTKLLSQYKNNGS